MNSTSAIEFWGQYNLAATAVAVSASAVAEPVGSLVKYASVNKKWGSRYTYTHMGKEICLQTAKQLILFNVMSEKFKALLYKSRNICKYPVISEPRKNVFDT